MFRKLSLVAVAVASPSAAALAGADVGFRLGLERRLASRRGPASRRRRPRLLRLCIRLLWLWRL
jgi:hypothetical protein